MIKVSGVSSVPIICTGSSSSIGPSGASGDSINEPSINSTKVGISPPTVFIEELTDGESTCQQKDEQISPSDTEFPCFQSDQAPIISESPKEDNFNLDLSEFVPPSEELKLKIKNQIEFYFSDANILKDAFLLKHVRKNKLGFVSVKLITSFKKVKYLTKDYRVVLFSLSDSETLEINSEKTKIRRKEPIPEYDETAPSRSVVAVNIPIENPSIENIAEIFSKFGEILLIRILRPGKALPSDVKKHINKHPELGESLCAVIEFENHVSALKACDVTDEEQYKKMHVVLLAKPKVPSTNKNEKILHVDSLMNKSEELSTANSEKKYRKPLKKKGSRVDELSTQSDIGASSSGSESEVVEIRRSEPKLIPVDNRRLSTGNMDSERSFSKEDRRSSNTSRYSLSPKDQPWLSPNTTPRSSPKNSPRNSPRGSPISRRRISHGVSPLINNDFSPCSSPRPSPRGSPESRRRGSANSLSGSEGNSPSSPWISRRMKAKITSPLAGCTPESSPRPTRKNDGLNGEELSPPRMLNMEGVLRQPYGPDYKPGFYGGLGRGKCNEISHSTVSSVDAMTHL